MPGAATIISVSIRHLRCHQNCRARTLHRFETITNNVVIACIHNADHLEADEPAVAEEHHIAFEED